MARAQAVAVLVFLTLLGGCAGPAEEAVRPARPSAADTSPSRSRGDVSQTPGTRAAAAARKICVQGAVHVLSAAIGDYIARGDVGPRYAEATRKIGQQSEGWRLASVLAPKVFTDLTAHGAASARRTAMTFALDACGRLHPNGAVTGAPDLSDVEPITVPHPSPTPPAVQKPTGARRCQALEESPSPFSGHWLTLANRGLYQDEVRTVQSQLNWLGYGCTPVDGDYGPETEGLVRQFQRDRGLVVDGQVGPQTWHALFGTS